MQFGDGSNGVGMINEANIGIGIYGKEVTQASRATDYVITQFSFFKKLLLFMEENFIQKILMLLFIIFIKIFYLFFLFSLILNKEKMKMKLKALILVIIQNNFLYKLLLLIYILLFLLCLKF